MASLMIRRPTGAAFRTVPTIRSPCGAPPPRAAWEPARGGDVQGRSEDSGDYEYDLAHERPDAAEQAAAHRPDARPAPAPAGRPVEYGQDMSYDEAHDF